MIDLTNITFESVVETTIDVVIVTDVDLAAPGPRILYVNPAFTRLTGYSAEEAIGRAPRFLQGPETNRNTLNKIRANLQAGLDVHEKILNYGKNGTRYWLDICITALRDNAGNIIAFTAVQRDVTHTMPRFDNAPNFTAPRDAFAGVPNLFGASSFPGANPYPKPNHLAYVNIDHLGEISARYGGATANAVQAVVADRLAQNIRRFDSVSQINPGAFGIFMGAVAMAGARMMCERLQNIITSQPISTPVGPLNISVSINIIEAGAESEAARDILSRASAAKHAAQHAAQQAAQQAAQHTATG